MLKATINMDINAKKGSRGVARYSTYVSHECEWNGCDASSVLRD